jgi:signal peptidase I
MTSATQSAPLSPWKIALGVLMLLGLFVLSFGLPLLALLLLVPPAVGIYRRARGRGRRLATVMIGVGLGLFFLRLFLPGLALRTVAIRSAAMKPTIGAHERVLFDRTGISSVRIGAIVAFHAPKDAHRRLCGPSPHMIKPGGAACAMSESEYKRGYYIRRVVAGPGDVISIVGGRVILNGRPEHEPYARACNESQCNFPKPIKVPRGMWFVMADNRRESDDSRFFGPVPGRWIIGVALMITWPPNKVGGL